MNGYITVEDIAHLYKLTSNHVYQLAHTREWRRIRYDGRVHYRIDDVADTLAPEVSQECRLGYCGMPGYCDSCAHECHGDTRSPGQDKTQPQATP